MDWHGSTVYALDDGDNSIQYMVKLLDSHNYCVLQDTDVNPETAPATEVNFIPILRLFTDNIIAVASCNDIVLATSALSRSLYIASNEGRRSHSPIAGIREATVSTLRVRPLIRKSSLLAQYWWLRV